MFEIIERLHKQEKQITEDERKKEKKIIRELNLYIASLKEGNDLRISFFNLGGNSRQILKVLMRQEILSQRKLDEDTLEGIIEMIRNAPSGMGDSQYLAMPLKTDKAPKAESKIFEMIKQIVNPENDELRFDSTHEQESIWFTAVSQNKLYTVIKMLSDRPDLITVCNDRL